MLQDNRFSKCFFCLLQVFGTAPFPPQVGSVWCCLMHVIIVPQCSSWAKTREPCALSFLVPFKNVSMQHLIVFLSQTFLVASYNVRLQ